MITRKGWHWNPNTADISFELFAWYQRVNWDFAEIEDHLDDEFYEDVCPEFDYVYAYTIEIDTDAHWVKVTPIEESNENPPTV